MHMHSVRACFVHSACAEYAPKAALLHEQEMSDAAITIAATPAQQDLPFHVSTDQYGNHCHGNCTIFYDMHDLEKYVKESGSSFGTTCYT